VALASPMKRTAASAPGYASADTALRPARYPNGCLKTRRTAARLLIADRTVVPSNGHRLEAHGHEH
jgi:hypothetical protein